MNSFQQGHTGRTKFKAADLQIPFVVGVPMETNKVHERYHVERILEAVERAGYRIGPLSAEGIAAMHEMNEETARLDDGPEAA